MIGSASGSAFWMIGGSTSGGTFFIAPATFSRTVLAASSRSRSSRNRTVMLARAAGVDVGRRHLVDAGDAAERVLHRHDHRRGHFVRGSRRAAAARRSRSRDRPSETGRRRGRGTRRCPAPRATSRASWRRPAAGRTARKAWVTPPSSLTDTFMPSARLSTSVSATCSPELDAARGFPCGRRLRSPVFSSCDGQRDRRSR